MFLSIVYSHSLLVITWSYGIVSKPQMFTKTMMFSSAAFPNVDITAQLTGVPIHRVLHSAITTIRQIRANLAASQRKFRLSCGHYEQNRSCNLTPGLKITLTGKFLLRINFLILFDTVRKFKYY